MNYDSTINNTVEQTYYELVETSSDINEHLPTFKKYSEECHHITEMGVRSVVSTYAFVVAKPKKLVSIDICHPKTWDDKWKSYGRKDIPSGANRLLDIEEYSKVNNIIYSFILGDTLQMNIEETDLLFIDTLHCYNQLKQELKLHEHRVKKYIILHDTESHKYTDEDSTGRIGTNSKDKIGLLPALEEFLESNSNWKIREIFVNCNGLTVLERISDESL